MVVSSVPPPAVDCVGLSFPSSPTGQTLDDVPQPPCGRVAGPPLFTCPRWCALGYFAVARVCAAGGAGGFWLGGFRSFLINSRSSLAYSSTTFRACSVRDWSSGSSSGGGGGCFFPMPLATSGTQPEFQFRD